MNAMNREQAGRIIGGIRNEIAKAFIGQDELVEYALITLLAGGHILLEGLPGLGKTLLVRSIAKAIGGDSRRVQFTPDLMPSDITGHIMLDASARNFVTKKGPVFTNLLIADEINRAPAKTQAALFEAMQEFQVSLDGTAYPLPRPFMTLATQNPLEHEGTYPLPDAQKDRFLMKVMVPFPSHEEEVVMVAKVLSGMTGAELITDEVGAVTTPGEFAEIQNLAAGQKVEQSVIDYAVRLASATRATPEIQSGAGPRGSLALIRGAKALSLMEQRDYVLPDDVKRLAVPALAHRIILSAESEIDGLNEQQVIERIVSRTEAPRS
ncbi:MAG: MoxR family ATPase [Spirochaetales bacterium]|nr:MoxR family ATPase [Spirochaetales bacterium]